MSRLHRRDYIRLRIASLPSVELEEIIAYVEHCKNEGVRLCNDKFPDTRFKGTYPRKHQEARWTIDLIRHEHKHGKYTVRK